MGPLWAWVVKVGAAPVERHGEKRQDLEAKGSKLARSGVGAHHP